MAAGHVPQIAVTTTDAAGHSLLRIVKAPDRRGHEWWRDFVTGDLRVPSVDRSGEWRDVSLSKGTLIARVYEFAPLMAHVTHHTDTYDIDVVMAGWVDLGVDGGSIRLEAGDMAIIRGDSHSWTAGRDGCTMLFVMLGVVASDTERPSDPASMRWGADDDSVVGTDDAVAPRTPPDPV